jgi:hypothetical protein
VSDEEMEVIGDRTSPSSQLYSLVLRVDVFRFELLCDVGVSMNSTVRKVNTSNSYFVSPYMREGC